MSDLRKTLPSCTKSEDELEAMVFNSWNGCLDFEVAKGSRNQMNKVVGICCKWWCRAEGREYFSLTLVKQPCPGHTDMDLDAVFPTCLTGNYIHTRPTKLVKGSHFLSFNSHRTATRVLFEVFYWMLTRTLRGDDTLSELSCPQVTRALHPDPLQVAALREMGALEYQNIKIIRRWWDVRFIWIQVHSVVVASCQLGFNSRLVLATGKNLLYPTFNTHIHVRSVYKLEKECIVLCKFFHGNRNAHSGAYRHSAP